MANPFQFVSGTAATSSTTVTGTVGTITATGDALVISVGVSGNTNGSIVTSVTDSQNNSYRKIESFESVNPVLSIWVADSFNNSGGPVALGLSDTVTGHVSPASSGAVAMQGTDCGITFGIDANVSNIANGSSTTPSVTSLGNIGSNEVALGLFAWSNTGGAGSISGTFTQLAQVHDNVYITSSYVIVSTPSVAITASGTITSTLWRAVMISFNTNVIRKPLIVRQAVNRSAVW